jgi:hypothetical protein
MILGKNRSSTLARYPVCDQCPDRIPAAHDRLSVGQCPNRVGVAQHLDGLPKPSQLARRPHISYMLAMSDHGDRLTMLGPADSIFPDGSLHRGDVQFVRRDTGRLVTHTGRIRCSRSTTSALRVSQRALKRPDPAAKCSSETAGQRSALAKTRTCNLLISSPISGFNLMSATISRRPPRSAPSQVKGHVRPSSRPPASAGVRRDSSVSVTSA